MLLPPTARPELTARLPLFREVCAVVLKFQSYLVQRSRPMRAGIVTVSPSVSLSYSSVSIPP